ncbi:MAG: flagellar biosynthetic protein FliO [Eubacterium sp.]|nr:flagellar biosynthetic protein FliO [Eubacterium sp.]
MWKSLGQLIWVLVLFVLVLLLTLLTTHFIARYQRGQVQGHQNLRIIETMSVSANGYIQIIEAGDVYLVIAVSKDHIEKLAELTKDQLKPQAFEDAAGHKIEMGESFHDILDKVKKHLPKK